MIDPDVQAKLDALSGALKAVTDSFAIHDQILKASRMGVNMVPVFHCNKSGLYFPADYIKQWGIDYGVGLGVDPISEVLDTEYGVAPPMPTPETDDIKQLMHPIGNTRTQVDLILVDQAVAHANMAILHKDDPKYKARIDVIFQKQLANPRSRLPALKVIWESMRQPSLLTQKGVFA